MRLSQNIKELFLNYISTNEVVYQICGELMEVANDNNCYNRNVILDLLAHDSSIELINRNECGTQESFYDLINWSTKDDVMFYVQERGLLICIPQKNAIESKLIAMS